MRSRAASAWTLSSVATAGAGLAKGMFHRLPHLDIFDEAVVDHPVEHHRAAFGDLRGRVDREIGADTEHEDGYGALGES